MTANYGYSRSKRKNLPLPIQMELSETSKTFCQFFISFLESTLNFEHFEKSMSLIAQIFLKLLTLKDVLTYMHKRSCFWKPFGSERVESFSIKELICNTYKDNNFSYGKLLTKKTIWQSYSGKKLKTSYLILKRLGRSIWQPTGVFLKMCFLERR